ncbi:DEAD-box ATP-dependent RNA helicase 42 [Mercurialis annua]|uniref:DEAD-box ATP-dependent RNA helicase 42 n=1 Tax=Mercurialis annua TaxID=3986 RepID=UPI00215F9BA0|nr:DEAD-box ATP-dependent RNA helicase 42 [Mercurialis annua]XP_050219036.1 DEAD-box ATP-dependent RNA helicase 42 [Mercurialis annua]
MGNDRNGCASVAEEETKDDDDINNIDDKLKKSKPKPRQMTGADSDSDSQHKTHSKHKRREKHIDEHSTSDSHSDTDSASVEERDHRKRDKEKRSSSRKRHRSKSYDSESESESDSGSEESEGESEEERRRRRKRRERRRRREKEEERERRRKKKDKEKKRRREEKEKRKKKKKKEKLEIGKRGAVTNSWGKYGIIRETDMWNKRPEFTAWLLEVKQVNLESLPNWEEKQMFKEFMEDHNTATFPSKKFYNLDAYHNRQMEKEWKKGFKKVQATERTVFNDEEQRRHELMREREKQKEQQVEAIKISMQSGMAQAMKEQALLKEEMALQYKLGNFEAAAAIQKRLDPDIPM